VKLFWIILAGACIIVAAFFLLRQDLDRAFVIAALGLVAWFLNYRAQMKEVIAAADLEENSKRDEEESYQDANHD
jgi:hypothetical protein